MLLLTVEAKAQERRVLTREEIEERVNPTLSTVAQGAIISEPSTRNMGEVADREVVNTYFTLHNTRDERVTVSELRSACSCLRVVTPITAIEAGESVTLRAEFNPSGRSGAFSIPILLYTSLDDNNPTARLTVEGSVVATEEWSHLPIAMGDIRLSRKSVVMDSRTRSERIVVVNVGDRALRLSAQPTIEGIALHTEPSQLQPGEEGDMVITYAPTTWPIQDIETALVVEGCGEARPTERLIKITIKH